MSKRDDAILAAVAALAGDLQSPDVVASIDTTIDKLRALRALAASLHGAAAPEPSNQTSEDTDSKTSVRPHKTLDDLIKRYLADDRSGYRDLRHKTRETYNRNLDRLKEDCGPFTPFDFTRNSITALYNKWTDNGRTPSMGYGFLTMLRVVVNYGATVVEDDDWLRASVILRHMRFKMRRPTGERMTREHAVAFIKKAHEMGYSELALAQAFQTDCGLRQTDVIGEWVPQSESGFSDVTAGSKKWLRGIRWNKISADNILEHTTSWNGRHREIDLNTAPLVKAELKRMGELPKSGPIILNPRKGIPHTAATFRALWREIADAAGIPKSVTNATSSHEARDDVSAKGKTAKG
jgi:hypothetical protein